MRQPVSQIKGIYLDDETKDLVLDIDELCEFFGKEKTPENKDLITKFVESEIKKIMPGKEILKETQVDSEEVN